MARCEVCGKHSITGSRISHSHKVNKRWFRPNLHKVRARVGNRVKRITVCTKCLRRVEKVV